MMKFFFGNIADDIESEPEFALKQSFIEEGKSHEVLKENMAPG